jgi:putative ATPase
VSRTTVFQLTELTPPDIKTALKRALADENNGLGAQAVDVSEDALGFLSEAANGDLRVALNALELAYLTTPRDDAGRIPVGLEAAEDCIQKRTLKYDKDGDNHYDTISAFIKSMRGSDPDAAVYWLAKMLYAGEDPKFIARRMVVFASEDVSNAEPYALTLAVSVFRAVEIIGLPECRINLAHGAVYLALCPKSNASYTALIRASSDIEKKPTLPVPAHLRSTGHPANVKFGNGIGYKYAHDYKNHYVPQRYLPRAAAMRITIRRTASPPKRS